MNYHIRISSYALTIGFISSLVFYFTNKIHYNVQTTPVGYDLVYRPKYKQQLLLKSLLFGIYITVFTNVFLDLPTIGIYRTPIYCKVTKGKQNNDRISVNIKDRNGKYIDWCIYSYKNLEVDRY